MTDKSRIVFLDYLRVFACLMVMFVHACEQFYFNGNGELFIKSPADAHWVTWIDSACRAAVPLFVMASSYLLFPLTRSTGEFFVRRLKRVFVPFALWSVVYVLRFDGSFVDCLFNFPMATGGHLWFVPMLLGLYLAMPLLSPWAEKASEKEVRGWLIVWMFTTTFPFLRRLCGILCGEPSFGAVPFLYGECPWNGFGMFQYVSGFFGYLLLGFYFRKFVPEWSWRRTLSRALPLWAIGYAIVGGFFFGRIPGDGTFPVQAPYAAAVNLEMSWEFCGTGVAMTVLGYFMVLRKCVSTGKFYERVIRPLSDVSYGTYLMHILVLVTLADNLKGSLPTPVAILVFAVGSFAVASLFGLLFRKIPKVNRWLIG